MKFKKLLKNIKVDVRNIILEKESSIEEKLNRLEKIFSFLNRKSSVEPGEIKDCSPVLEHLKDFIQPSDIHIGKDGFVGYLFTNMQVKAACNKLDIKINAFNKFLSSKGFIQKQDHSYSFVKKGYGGRKVARYYSISQDAFDQSF